MSRVPSWADGGNLWSRNNPFSLQNLPLPVVHSEFIVDLSAVRRETESYQAGLQRFLAAQGIEVMDEPLLIHDRHPYGGLSWYCPVCEFGYSVREVVVRRHQGEQWCYRCEPSSSGNCGLFRVRPYTVPLGDGLSVRGYHRTGWRYQIFVFNEVVCDTDAERELPTLRQAVEEAVRFRADAPQWVKVLAGYARRRLLYGDGVVLCPDCGQNMAQDHRKQIWCRNPDCGLGCEWQTEKPYPVFMPPFAEDSKLHALQNWLVENGYDVQAASVKKGMGL